MLARHGIVVYMTVKNRQLHFVRLCQTITCQKHLCKRKCVYYVQYVLGYPVFLTPDRVAVMLFILITAYRHSGDTSAR